MKRINIFIKTLAIFGTIFSWIPILTPTIFFTIKLISDHQFLFDYLMPAELFPVALIGGISLIIVAKKIKFCKKLIYTSTGLAIGSLIFGQIFAVFSGLASGKIEPTGWPWLVVILSIAMYSLALIWLGLGGIFLLKKCF